eukprot:CAMPEP_0118850630 /NCGR_PEP_ID=MMETSP1163-20130328/400_1 /TAXON_ID=124430 /ORGANISM="Phaeomonas parva, Strain CCMP2877" /LENGTH=474 /DNA_ID=CAMNT_0006782855 /DNA_START=328 /DNA_END=1752 /DNA_ORIENTATION=+
MGIFGALKRKVFGDKEFQGAVSGKSALLQMMNMMNISEGEAAKVFHIFEKVDNDHSGTIDIVEFLQFFELEGSGGGFARRCFDAMDFDKDDDGEGALDYGEFFVSLYNYCTLTHETLVRFTFDMIDADRSGAIDHKELYNLISVMHLPNEVDKVFTRVMKVLDADESGQISFKEFKEANSRVQSIMMPAFALQRSLRSRCMGARFWRKATKRRIKVFGANADDLVDKYLELMGKGRDPVDEAEDSEDEEEEEEEEEGEHNDAGPDDVEYESDESDESSEDDFYEDVDKAIKKARKSKRVRKRAKRGARLTLLKMRFKREHGVSAAQDAKAFARFKAGIDAREEQGDSEEPEEPPIRVGDWWCETFDPNAGDLDGESLMLINTDNADLLERMTEIEQAALDMQVETDDLLAQTRAEFEKLPSGWRAETTVRIKRWFRGEKVSPQPAVPEVDDDDEDGESGATGEEEESQVSAENA